MAKISTTAEINSIRLKEQAADVATPANGYGQLYIKADGLYFRGDNGTVIGPLGTGGGGGGVGVHRVRVYRSTTQSIPNGAWTSVQWDNERWDTDAYHDNVTNNTRLTVPTGHAGDYTAHGSIGWPTSASQHYRGMRIRLNGTTTIWIHLPVPSSGASRVHILNIAMPAYPLVAGDFLELQLLQDSGGAVSIDPSTSTDYITEFAMQRVA